jgi:hypothetical protein
MGSGVSDVSIRHVVSDRVQDAQEFGTVATATEQGEGEVSSHQNSGRKVGGSL